MSPHFAATTHSELSSPHGRTEPWLNRSHVGREEPYPFRSPRADSCYLQSRWARVACPLGHQSGNISLEKLLSKFPGTIIHKIKKLYYTEIGQVPFQDHRITEW